MSPIVTFEPYSAYRRGLCVRSPFGLGQILAGGDAPLVRFLDGRECHVAKESLTIVPHEILKAEIENRTRWNRLMTLRVCGPRGLDGSEPLWVQDGDGIWISAEKFRQKPKHPPGTMPYFLPDDIGEECSVLSAGDPA